MYEKLIESAAISLEKSERATVAGKTIALLKSIACSLLAIAQMMKEKRDEERS